MLASSTLTSLPGSPSPQVDATLFAEFQAWRESPTLDKTCPFLERVYREDVGPCLDFTMQEVRRAEGGQKVGGDGGGKEGGSQPLSPLAGGQPLTAPPAALLCRSSRPWSGLLWRTTHSPSSPWLRRHCPR